MSFGEILDPNDAPKSFNVRDVKSGGIVDGADGASIVAQRASQVHILTRLRHRFSCGSSALLSALKDGIHSRGVAPLLDLRAVGSSQSEHKSILYLREELSDFRCVSDAFYKRWLNRCASNYTLLLPSQQMVTYIISKAYAKHLSCLMLPGTTVLTQPVTPESFSSIFKLMRTELITKVLFKPGYSWGGKRQFIAKSSTQAALRKVNALIEKFGLVIVQPYIPHRSSMTCFLEYKFPVLHGELSVTKLQAVAKDSKDESPLRTCHIFAQTYLRRIEQCIQLQTCSKLPSAWRMDVVYVPHLDAAFLNEIELVGAEYEFHIQGTEVSYSKEVAECILDDIMQAMTTLRSEHSVDDVEDRGVLAITDKVSSAGGSAGRAAGLCSHGGLDG